MDHPFFAHRRTLVAASFAGLALLVFAPKSYGKIPQAGSTAVREQSAHRTPATSEASWASEREQLPLRTVPPAVPLISGAERELIPETDTHVARVDTPTASDWTDELALGTGFLAALVLTGGMTMVLRHRRTVSTIR